MCYTTRVEFLAALGPQAGVVGGSGARGVLPTLWEQFNDVSRSEVKDQSAWSWGNDPDRLNCMVTGGFESEVDNKLRTGVVATSCL